MDYDDERELTAYVWDNYGHLLTEFEQRVGRAVIGRLKASREPEGSSVRRMLNERWGRAGDPEIEAALADGPEAFRRRAAERVLGERATEVFVNRCPACACVVRTPRARQCFWCGHDWH